jgi:hypothetical protein
VVVGLAEKIIIWHDFPGVALRHATGYGMPFCGWVFETDPDRIVFVQNGHGDISLPETGPDLINRSVSQVEYLGEAGFLQGIEMLHNG